jgi:hypothetical protein
MDERSSHMRRIIVALALLALPITAAKANVPDMTCKAARGVAGPEGRPQEMTDVFRIANGRLYHRWSGKGEYFYNDIVETDFRRYVSGHMVFVMTNNGQSGYVVVAASTDWRVVYLNCER